MSDRPEPTDPVTALDSDAADQQHRDTGCRQPEHCLHPTCACHA